MRVALFGIVVSVWLALPLSAAADNNALVAASGSQSDRPTLEVTYATSAGHAAVTVDVVVLTVAAMALLLIAGGVLLSRQRPAMVRRLVRRPPAPGRAPHASD